MATERDENQPGLSIAKTALGPLLVDALIAEQRYIELGMPLEAGVFNVTVKEVRSQLSDAGLDPNEVIKEQLRLLNKALERSS